MSDVKVEFVKFLDETAPEIQDNEDEILLFLYAFQVKEFVDIFKNQSHLYDDDSSVRCWLNSDYFVFDLFDFFQDDDVRELVGQFVS